MADMPEDVVSSQTSTADVGVTTPPSNGVPPAGVPQTPAPDGDSERWTNKTEFVQVAKRSRENGKGISAIGERLAKIEQMLTSQSGQTPAAPDDEPPKREQVRAKDVQTNMEHRFADMEFRESLAELEQPLTKAQKNVLLRLYRADRPSNEDLPEWLAANMGAFPKQETPAAIVPPVPQAPQVSNSGGAPTVDPRSGLPVDIFAVDPTVWKALSPKEKAEHFESYKRSRGPQGNPFAALKTTP